MMVLILFNQSMMVLMYSLKSIMFLSSAISYLVFYKSFLLSGIYSFFFWISFLCISTWVLPAKQTGIFSNKNCNFQPFTGRIINGECFFRDCNKSEKCKSEKPSSRDKGLLKFFKSLFFHYSFRLFLQSFSCHKTINNH